MSQPPPTQSDDNPEQEILLPHEAASILRVSPKTLNNWASAGQLHFFRTPGGHLRFHRSVIMALYAGDAEGVFPTSFTVPQQRTAPAAESTSPEGV
jgi:excisionase family DNA binding protein